MGDLAAIEEVGGELPDPDESVRWRDAARYEFNAMRAAVSPLRTALDHRQAVEVGI